MIDAKKKVNLALAQYAQGIDRFNSGWNILRYAKAGYIKIDSTEFAHDFMQWYPSDPDYLILDLAQAGELSYNGPEDEEINEGEKS